ERDRPLRGPAAELEYVQAGDVAEHAELSLGDLPDAPAHPARDLRAVTLLVGVALRVPAGAVLAGGRRELFARGPHDVRRMRLVRRLGDRDDPALTAGLELHHARAHREQRVITADADAVAGPEARAPLAHDDLAARHPLAAENLDAQHL